MTNLRVRPRGPDSGGRVIDITPSSAGWRYVGFEVRLMAKGQSASFKFDGREACILILSGTADIEVGGQKFEGVGGRASVFDEAAPGAVYAPAFQLDRPHRGHRHRGRGLHRPGSGAGAPRLIGSRPHGRGNARLGDQPAVRPQHPARD